MECIRCPSAGRHHASEREVNKKSKAGAKYRRETQERNDGQPSNGVLYLQSTDMSLCANIQLEILAWTASAGHHPTGQYSGGWYSTGCRMMNIAPVSQDDPPGKLNFGNRIPATGLPFAVWQSPYRLPGAAGANVVRLLSLGPGHRGESCCREVLRQSGSARLSLQ